MSFNLDNFKNQPPIVVLNDEDINGLSLFKKRLEKLFFSNIIIRNSDVKGKTAKLIIEINCNFSFLEGMCQLREGIWAQLQKCSEQPYRDSEFYNLVLQLQKKNDFLIEVEEFSLLFSDSNIIINRVYERSIPEQLDALLSELANHYVGLTEGMSQVPYEIFIPVFEEDMNCLPDCETLVFNIDTEGHKASNYFDYWAIYYDSCEDPLMYDLKKRSVINGELNMLNE